MTVGWLGGFGPFIPVLIYIGGFLVIIVGYLGWIWWVGVCHRTTELPEEEERW